jgi:hypothetical protein
VQGETKEWWLHHRTQVPNFKDEADKIRVQDLTGCIPLLLRPFLGWNGQDYCAVKENIWHSRDLIAVTNNVQEFARRKNGDPNTDYEE